jgi:cell envelope-related function transcriptional attenuator common domain
MAAIKNFMITFCISALLFGLAAYFVMSFALENNMLPIFSDDNNTNNNQSDINNPSNSDPDNPDYTSGSEEEEYGEALAADVNTITALLIGTDYQPDIFNDYNLSELNENITGFPYKERMINTDTIMMVHINNNLKTFMISSIPSNMSLLVDGVYKKLSTLYSEKGIQFLCDKVKSVTGLNIDYYAVIALDKFAEVIDEFGGVSFPVPTDMLYEDPSQDLVIELSKGEQTLNGDKAVKMLRYRSYSDGDVSRMSVTVDFMRAFLFKLINPEYITKSAELYANFSDIVETNFTEIDLAENIESILAYSIFETSVINYPGTPKDDIFEPNITNAINTYKQYK